MNGDELKALRAKAGLSVAEAARLVTVSERTWKRFESGDKVAPPGMVELFCIKTGIPPAEAPGSGTIDISHLPPRGQACVRQAYEILNANSPYKGEVKELAKKMESEEISIEDAEKEMCRIYAKELTRLIKEGKEGEK